MTTESLEHQTQKLLQDFMSSLPENDQQTVAAAFDKLMSSNAGDDAPQEGDIAPDFDLANARSSRTQLKTLLSKGPVVLSFYRGGWCPFCNLEFKALTDILPKIEAMGASLVGISPETVDRSLSTIEQHALPFEVLSDQGNNIAKAYGLVVTVDEAIRPLYEQWGIDIPSANGDDSFQLPIPATFIIKQNGVIQACYVNKNYTTRMEPEEILKALSSI